MEQMGLGDNAESAFRKRINKLVSENEALASKIQHKDQEFAELLDYSNMVVTLTNPELSIINIFGDTEFVFEELAPGIKHGDNLLLLIQKITGSVKARSSTGGDSEDISSVLDNFIQGRREQRIIEVIGERDNGDVFLVIWRIIRLDKRFKSFIKIVPTNSIIEACKKTYDERFEEQTSMQDVILDLIPLGITLLGVDGTIQFTNETAKSLYIARDNPLLRSASFRGRRFSELFVSESSEMVKFRESKNNAVIISRKAEEYESKLHDRYVKFQILPLLNKRSNILGLVIISTDMTDNGNSNAPKVDTNKLMATLKALMRDKKTLSERIKELENNHHWFMKNNKAYEIKIKLFFSFIRNLPFPASIQILPTKKYEYVNYEFEKQMRTSNDQVKGKMDEQVFTKSEAKYLSDITDHALQTKKNIEFDELTISGRQAIVLNPSRMATHIIRIYTKLL